MLYLIPILMLLVSDFEELLSLQKRMNGVSKSHLDVASVRLRRTGVVIEADEWCIEFPYSVSLTDFVGRSLSVMSR